MGLRLTFFFNVNPRVFLSVLYNRTNTFFVVDGDLREVSLVIPNKEYCAQGRLFQFTIVQPDLSRRLCKKAVEVRLKVTLVFQKFGAGRVNGVDALTTINGNAVGLECRKQPYGVSFVGILSNILVELRRTGRDSRH